MSSDVTNRNQLYAAELRGEKVLHMDDFAKTIHNAICTHPEFEDWIYSLYPISRKNNTSDILLFVIDLTDDDITKIIQKLNELGVKKNDIS